MTGKKRSASGRGAGPNAVDIYVGYRIRQRRTLLGLSQEKLGEALGLTFQQIQKYERGTNRVSASRLYDLARILDIEPNYFFEGMAEETARRSPGRLHGMAEDAAKYQPTPDPSLKRETLELVRSYYRIEDQMRHRLFEMTKALAGQSKKRGSKNKG